jgi:alpha-galactosidase
VEKQETSPGFAGKSRRISIMGLVAVHPGFLVSLLLFSLAGATACGTSPGGAAGGPDGSGGQPDSGPDPDGGPGPGGDSLDTTTLKVFVMAGQSNMEGKGRVTPTQENIDENGGMGTLDYLIDDPTQAPLYDHFKASDGSWIVRDDVWIAYLDRSEPLTVEGLQTFGPELQFAFTMADYYENPVLIIKTAWGGKSLYVDFRPPSSGGEVGPYYTMMVERVREVLGKLSDHALGYEGTEYEIAGFGWHQGWNDRVNSDANVEYQENCVNLINDLRVDLGATQMPFVIATTGMSGWAETHPRAISLMEAQLAAANDPNLEFGDVTTVDTRDFFRLAEYSPAGPNQGFHWHHNAETMFLMGRAMAEQMIMLRGDGDGLDDACPDDASKYFAGRCGCGETERDSDNDGLPDCIDGCPDDPHNAGDCQ